MTIMEGTRRPGPSWPLHLCGISAAVVYALLARQSRHAGGVPLSWYFPLLGLAWAALLAAWLAIGSGRPRAWVGLFAWAVVFRLFAFVGDPVLEDDPYRYLWDGRQFAWYGNPYDKPPRDWFDDDVDDPLASVLDRVNHPHLPTIYGPVAQYLFLLGYLLDPGRLWSLKLVLIAADLGLLAGLARLGAARAVLLYGWCPLVIQEVGFTAHLDGLGAALLVWALSASARGRAGAAGALLALACGTKPTAVLLLPFLLLATGRHWPRAVTAAGLLGILLHLPFTVQGSLAGYDVLSTFLRTWEFNGSLYAALAAPFGPVAARAACGTVFVGGYGAYLVWAARQGAARRPGAPLPRGDWIYGWLLLCSATVNPWYALWLAPFVAVYPSAWGIATLAALPLSYACGLHLGGDLAPYRHPAWVQPVEYGAIALALLYDAWRIRRAS